MKKALLYLLLIFLLSTILITIFYVFFVNGSFKDVSIVSLKNITFRYGFVGGAIVSVFFFSAYISFKTIKSKWFFSVVLIILTILFFYASYLYAWYFVVEGLSNNPFVD